MTVWWTVWLYFSVLAIGEEASEDCCSVYLLVWPVSLVTSLVADLSALVADSARPVWLGASSMVLQS